MFGFESKASKKIKALEAKVQELAYEIGRLRDENSIPIGEVNYHHWGDRRPRIHVVSVVNMLLEKSEIEIRQTPGKTELVSKNTKGDVVAVHCCDECARRAGVKPKNPADSGESSWYCEVCGHYGIGSLTDCEIGDWLRLRPLQPNQEQTTNDRMGWPLERRVMRRD